jgi:hypothetical protein
MSFSGCATGCLSPRSNPRPPGRSVVMHERGDRRSRRGQTGCECRGQRVAIDDDGEEIDRRAREDARDQVVAAQPSDAARVFVVLDPGLQNLKCSVVAYVTAAGSRSSPRAVLADRDHLLDRLASNTQLPGQIGLRETVGQQRVNQPAPLPGQLLRRASMLDRGCPDPLQLIEALGVSRRFEVLGHEHSMTTPGCRVNRGLSGASSVAAGWYGSASTSADKVVRSQ